MLSPKKLKNFIGAAVSIVAILGYPVGAAIEYIKNKKGNDNV